MYMELHDERGGYNIQQYPPPSVHVDTERATHKLNVAMMIKFSQNLQPTRNGLSMQWWQSFPKFSKISGDAYGPAWREEDTTTSNNFLLHRYGGTQSELLRSSTAAMMIKFSQNLQTAKNGPTMQSWPFFPPILKFGMMHMELHGGRRIQHPTTFPYPRYTRAHRASYSEAQYCNDDKFSKNPQTARDGLTHAMATIFPLIRRNSGCWTRSCMMGGGYNHFLHPPDNKKGWKRGRGGAQNL